MKGDLTKKLGLRIRELRLSKNLTQSALADNLEMERNNLTRIESGKQRPNDENLEKIAQILNVDVCELFNFGHIKTREELISEINTALSNYSESEIQFCHKMILNLKQIK